MTYAEQQGEMPFDWNEFLNRKVISDAEWEKADKLAVDWVTCACGNLCEVIPRLANGMPDDDELAWSGARFSDAIATKRKPSPSCKTSKNALPNLSQKSKQTLS